MHNKQALQEEREERKKQQALLAVEREKEDKQREEDELAKVRIYVTLEFVSTPTNIFILVMIFWICFLLDAHLHIYLFFYIELVNLVLMYYISFVLKGRRNAFSKRAERKRGI